MRRNVFIGAALIIGFLGAATLDALPTRRAAVVRFLRPTMIAGAFVLGTVVIEHDDEQMARGKPCTTVYHFDADTNGRGEPIISFMCMPRATNVATKFEATLNKSVSWPDRLTEYQLAGESEAHGVPAGK